MIQRPYITAGASAIAVALIVLSPSARAGELIVLQNGFEVRCDHYAPVDGRVRLYQVHLPEQVIDGVIFKPTTQFLRIEGGGASTQ